MVCNSSGTNALLDLILSQLFAVKILHHELFVLFCNVLNHIVMILLSLFLHILGDILNTDVLSEIIIVNVSLHFNEVDDSSEFIFSADRKLNRNGVTFKSVLHHVYDTVEVGTHNIHLIYISHTGNLIIVSLSPNGFRLGLNTTLSAENGYRTVQHSE